MTTAIDQHIAHILKWHPTLTSLDVPYLRNRLRALVGDSAAAVPGTADPLANLDALVAATVANGACADTQAAKDILAANLMDWATPSPSAVNTAFWTRYAASPSAATDWFYALSQANNYIQTRAIAKNVRFVAPSDYGDLEITINLSKPEKDPKDIAAAATAHDFGYPACQLCLENEGYAGRADYPARANHRIVRFTLGGRPWGFQYSPYAYFGEHAIFLDTQHVPMHINRATFDHLLDIVTWLPDYFVGSNADLPIVGGSMLSHEHYQGGRHTFAMAVAPVEKSFAMAAFAGVTAGVVKWPMSVLRLTAEDREQLAAAAEHVRATWATYSDEAVDVRAETNGTPHHTVTPIARRVDGAYQLDLVLRDNQTSAEFPDGIFHPHPDVQHIKKENIGLIEVMGLAVLPARLKSELTEVKHYLLDEPNQMADSHKTWADELAAAYEWTPANADAQLNAAVAAVFSRVLEDAGVFKRTEAGQAAFNRFIAAL